jgi:hypothetical protein
MMGRLKRDQGQFFYSFRLDEAVPGDHPVRDIAAVIAIASQAACGQSLRPKGCKHRRKNQRHGA